MPSRVLATVRSCINGSRLRSSLFICQKSEQTVFVYYFLEAIPHLSVNSDVISASRIYLLTIDITIDLFTPSVSATNRLSSASSSKARTNLWRCFKGILFLGGISTVVLKISIHVHVSALAKRNTYMYRYRYKMSSSVQYIGILFEKTLRNHWLIIVKVIHRTIHTYFPGKNTISY